MNFFLQKQNQISIEQTKKLNAFSADTSFGNVFCKEWKWWLPGAILSFFMASLLLSGWPMGLIPNTSYPFIYEADGLSHSWLIQRLIEGWIYNNPRSGYPFGSNFMDYPWSDFGTDILLKIFGLLTDKYYSTLNLYFLFSFPVIFITSFCVLRTFSLNISFASVASLLFDFIPFHFQRLGHLFYTWYFVVPLFFYIGFLVYYAKDSFLKNKSTKFCLFFTCLLLASFNVYYSIFGLIVLCTATFVAIMRYKDLRVIKLGIITSLIVILGVGINLSPNLVHRYFNGKNTEVAVRSPGHAEILGLKLIQLVIPRADHRIYGIAKITKKYESTHILVNENKFSTLGVVGAVGFFLLGLLILLNLSGTVVDSRLTLLACIVYILFFFGTIGGLGALFAQFISSSFRGWNRISVFISFGSIAAFFLTLQMLLERFVPHSKTNVIIIIIAFCILTCGIYDQTISTCKECNMHTKKIFEQEKKFIQQIEQIVPMHSAIYQLPYMPFPEPGDQLSNISIPEDVVPYELGPYALVSGFLHSKSLYWNFGGMKGREGDLFYRALSVETLEKQIEVLNNLGFSGIYIDRRGYKNNAKKIIFELTKLLNANPILDSENHVFFQLKPKNKPNLKGLSNLEIMQKAGYVVDKLGARYEANLNDGIDFTRFNWPSFIRNVQGISEPAPQYGRWSDANISPTVRIDFISALPQQFKLILVAVPFGPNINQNLTIKLGSQIYQLKMPPEVSEQQISINLIDKDVKFIEFIPFYPISPLELRASPDKRKLGIRFISLQFK